MGSTAQQLEQQFLDAYDAYADAIFRFVILRLRDRDAAKDLLQDVFVRTWDYLRAGKEVREMRPFLYQVARNLIIDNLRKSHGTVSLDQLL